MAAGPCSATSSGMGRLGDRPAFLLFGVEPGVEEHEEDELRPAEVGHVGRGQLAVPVIAEAQHLQLAAEVVDVALGRGPRMGAGLLGVLLGRQPEGVPAHGVHDAIAPVAAVAADDIGGRVAFRMADVQAGAAGVGEHVQDIHLGPLRQPGGSERAVRFPILLPFRFDRGRVIAWHVADLRGARKNKTCIVPSSMKSGNLNNRIASKLLVICVAGQIASRDR